MEEHWLFQLVGIKNEWDWYCGGGKEKYEAMKMLGELRECLDDHP